MNDAAIGKDTHQERGLEHGGHGHAAERVPKLAGDIVRRDIIQASAWRLPSLGHRVGARDLAVESDPQHGTGGGRSSRAACAPDGEAHAPTGKDGSTARVRLNVLRRDRHGVGPLVRPDHALILPSCVEELVRAMADIAHDHGAVPQHREAHRLVELAGTSTRGAELAHEAPRRVEHEDSHIPGTHQRHPPETRRTGSPVENVEVAFGVEGYAAHLGKHLPGFTVQDADPVHLLEIGFDRPVPARDVDHLLGQEERRGKRGACETEDDPEGETAQSSLCHSGFSSQGHSPHRADVSRV